MGFFKNLGKGLNKAVKKTGEMYDAYEDKMDAHEKKQIQKLQQQNKLLKVKYSQKQLKEKLQKENQKYKGKSDMDRYIFG